MHSKHVTALIAFLSCRIDVFYLATNNNKNEDGVEDDISTSVKQREVFYLKMVLGLAKMVTFGGFSLYLLPRVLHPLLRNIRLQMQEASGCLA